MPESPRSDSTLSRPVKDRVMRRFDTWLDNVLSAERAPEGLDREILERVMGEDGTSAPEGCVDLYSVVAGLTALTTEVKLQGRTFKELHDKLGPTSSQEEAIKSLAIALDDEQRARIDERIRQAEQQTRASLITVLLDVRDRLERGLRQARLRLETPQPDIPGRRLLRFFARPETPQRHEEREALQAFEKGYTLGIDRLDQALTELGITPLAIAPGEAFDPRTMNAVDVEETAGVPEGSVREVYRTGYLWNGDLLRTAEVKVARPPSRNEDVHGAG